MTEERATVELRQDRTVKEILAVSGLTIGDVCAAYSLLFESGPLNEDSKLSPGETAVILAFGTFVRMGYARDRTALLLRPFIPNIVEFVATDNPERLGLVIVYDNRFGMWELDPAKIVNLHDGAVLPRAVLPLPVATVSVSILGLYLRTFSTPRSQSAAAEVEKSDQQGPEASPDSPAQQSLPFPSK